MKTADVRLRALVDTNVLLYAANTDDGRSRVCQQLLKHDLRTTHRLCLTPQILFEYFAVITNANFTGRPLTRDQALLDISHWAELLPVLPISPTVHEQVFDLLRTTRTTGRHIFDLELAATMLAHNVSTIYTYDGRFNTIPGITACEP